MEFRVLGPFEVLASGGRVDIRGPRQLGLLVALLAHANQVVSTDRLVEELWGDDPSPSVATSLQVNVSRLRRSLEAGAGGSCAIVTRRPGYVLRTDPDSIDALRFERLAAQGRSLLATGDAIQAGRDLRAALELWRGPALTEFADHPSARAWAERLQLLRSAALDERLHADLALGRHAEVVDELYALVAEDPLRERRWGQLMLALYRCGRQAEALRAFTDLRATLAEELGIDPSPELRTLEEHILLQRPDLDWRPHPSAVRASTSPGRRDSPLVGREAELGVLVEQLDRAVAGQGGLVLIRGEPGIGKTRMAEELASVASAAGATVLWGRCTEDGGGPYCPWVGVLGPWWESTDAVALRSAPAAEADRDGARLRLFRAVAGFLRSRRESGPLVIVLDDLQWADAASLLLLQHLARELAGSGILVIGTYRNVDLGRDHPLTVALGDLARQPAIERLQLGGLTPADVGKMIEWRTGLPPGHLADTVHRRTEGNPFFVCEVVRLLETDNGLASQLEPGPTGIPEGVREVVGRRCARLSTAAHRLLGLAAVAGRDFQVALLEAVWDGHEPVLDLLEEAEVAGLLAGDRLVVGGYRFSHDIVRETVSDELSPLRRARLHGRIGAVLLDGPGPSDAAACAHHLLLGIPAGVDPQLAAVQAAGAGEAAVRSLAYEQAVHWYERALAAVAGDIRAGGIGLVDVLLGLGDARWRVGDVPGARQAFLDAADRAMELGDSGRLARAVLGFGGGALRSWHATRGAFGDRPLRLLEEALDRTGPDDGAVRAQLLGLLAEELYYTPALARRDELSREAVALARQLDDRPALASALISRCLAIWGPDRLPERLAAASELVRLAEELDDPQLGFFGHQYVFVARFEEGNATAARAALDRLEALAEHLRQPLARWEARRYRAMLALFAGALEDAECLALEALALAQSAQEPDAMPVFAVQLAVIRFEQGRLAELETAIEAFVAEFAESPAWRAALGVVKAELGDEDQARAELEGLSAGGFRGIPRDFAWLAAMAMLSQLCAMLGDGRRAALLTDLLFPFAGRNAMTGDRQAWGSTSRYLGLLAHTEGRLDDARRWFERAIDENLRMGSAPWAAYARCELADTLLRSGDETQRRRAEALAAEAADAARSLRLVRLLAAAESTLRWARGDEPAPGDAHIVTARPWRPAPVTTG